MRRQGKQFGDQGGERRFGGRGQDFRARGPRGDDRRMGEGRGPRDGAGPRSNDFRGGEFRGRSGGFERRGNFQDERGPRPGTYRRPDGAQGGYGRAPAPFAPRGQAPAPSVAAAPSCVNAQQLKAGIGQANKALAEVIEQFGHTLRGDYDIGAIEVTVSFGEDGRFLGFGAGGAASMKLSLTPLDAEAVMEGDEDEDEDFGNLELERDEGRAAQSAQADNDGEAQHFDA